MQCTFLSQLKTIIKVFLWDACLQNYSLTNIDVEIAAQSPVNLAVPGVITPPLPPR